MTIACQGIKFLTIASPVIKVMILAGQEIMFVTHTGQVIIVMILACQGIIVETIAVKWKQLRLLLLKNKSYDFYHSRNKVANITSQGIKLWL